MSEKLIPPDKKQCQSLIPTSNDFMAMGGDAGCIKVDDGEYLFFGWASS